MNIHMLPKIYFIVAVGFFCLLSAPLSIAAESAAKPKITPKIRPKITPRVQPKMNPAREERTDGSASRNRVRLPANTTQLSCKTISRTDAINKAKLRVKGKVVGVTFREGIQQPYYRVRILDKDKRVKTISVKACR